MNELEFLFEFLLEFSEDLLVNFTVDLCKAHIRL